MVCGGLGFKMKDHPGRGPAVAPCLFMVAGGPLHPSGGDATPSSHTSRLTHLSVISLLLLFR